MKKQNISFFVFCSIVAIVGVWLGTTIWTRWKVTFFILRLLGLNGGCHAETNVQPQAPPTQSQLVEQTSINTGVRLKYAINPDGSRYLEPK